MDITDAQFELFRKKSLELAMHKYAAAMFNCTNFGLDDFNCVRVKPITIDSYTFYLPNDNSMTLIAADPDKIIVNKTPQMLFKKLKEMKDHNDPEAPNIIIDQSGATKAPLSHGECD